MRFDSLGFGRRQLKDGLKKQSAARAKGYENGDEQVFTEFFYLHRVPLVRRDDGQSRRRDWRSVKTRVASLYVHKSPRRYIGPCRRLPGFYRVFHALFIVSRGCIRVLSHLTGLYRPFTEFYRVLPSFTEFELGLLLLPLGSTRSTTRID